MSDDEAVEVPGGFAVDVAEPARGHVTIRVEYGVPDEDLLAAGASLVEVIRARLWAAGVISRAAWEVWTALLHPAAVDHKCWRTARPDADVDDVCGVWCSTALSLPQPFLDVDEVVAAFLVVPQDRSAFYARHVRQALAAVVRLDREVLAWAARGGDEPAARDAS
ncbi:hypothetical protein [Kineococcus arenarius]|uniref:hypothetical protein n=1 Tax=unclassified Kineococcus TaxID=2621656 RepID=UPI003D7EB8F9